MNPARAIAFAACAAVLALGPVAARCDTGSTPAQRALLVVNRGNRPIFEIRIGRDAAQSWSGDLLGFATVIDVSSGKEVPLAGVPAGCVWDVLAVYRGGHEEIQHDVNLCSTSRIDFTY